MSVRFGRRAGGAILAAMLSLTACGEAAPPVRPGKPGATASAAGDWPQFRGPNRDGKAADTGLLQTWPSSGPKLLWTARHIGRGYSSPAVVGDKLVILGTKEKEAEGAFCLSAKDGKELWATPIGKFYENNWGGGPRSTPTIDGDKVYCLGGLGDLACLDLRTGRKLWSTSLTADWGGKVEAWGYSESPLVDGKKVVVTAGGKNFLVAFDKVTGKKIWTSTGIDDGAQYASIMRHEVNKIPVYLTLTKGGLVGLNANTGEFQFRFDKTGNKTAAIPTPVPYEDTVYSTSGYGTGCGLVKLSVQGGKVSAEETYFNKDMINHHGGVILHEGHIYGYSDGKGWVCQKLDSGETAWRERNGLGKGSITFADGRFICYSENEGTAVLIEPSPEGWKEHGRFTIPEETKLERGSGKVWTHPVVAHGKLYLRDQDLLFCFDLQAK